MQQMISVTLFGGDGRSKVAKDLKSLAQIGIDILDGKNNQIMNT